MASNRLALTVLGIGCIAAASGGSYLATRQNVASVAAPAAASANPPIQPTISSSGAVTASLDGSARDGVARTRVLPAQSRSQSTPPATAVRNSQRRPESTTTTVEQPVEVIARAQDVAAAPDHGGLTPAAATPPTVAEEPATLPAIASDARPVEIPLQPEPAERRFQELVVSADSVIGLQTESVLSSARARVEDQVEARVVRDVRVNGEVAIPAGTRALGTVVVVERGGRLRGRARLGIRFQSLQFAAGTRMPITTETIFRFGDAPSNGSAAKIGGGAVAGAILGAIIGGGKGAAIGATAGAGSGAAAVMNSDRAEAVFPQGSEVTARILSPITVTIERE